MNKHFDENYYVSIIVFISTPYTNENHPDVYKYHVDIANKLLDMGFIPLSTILIFHPLYSINQREYDLWLNMSIELLAKCDVVLNFGTSNGTIKELEFAEANNIEIYKSFETLETLL